MFSLIDISIALTLRLLNIHEEANLILMIASNLWTTWSLLVPPVAWVS